MSEKHCGYIAIVGRPNVGKSTLLNRLLGKKLSITSRKPQTTRQRIIGVHTEGDTQMIFVDTPGLNQNMPRKINEYMNKAATSAIKDVDLVLFVVDGIFYNDGDAWALSMLEYTDKPVILVINKTDTVSDEQLIPHTLELAKLGDFAAIVPVSANSGKGVERLRSVIQTYLPASDFFYFDEDQTTDKDIRFVLAEMVREKIMRALGEELPYETHVVIERLVKEEKITHVHACIFVARESQKPIVIGKGGARLKSIGTQSRLDMEKYLGTKVMLKCWVKVRDGWSDSDTQIQQFGYDE